MPGLGIMCSKLRQLYVPSPGIFRKWHVCVWFFCLYCLLIAKNFVTLRHQLNDNDMGQCLNPKAVQGFQEDIRRASAFDYFTVMNRLIILILSLLSVGAYAQDTTTVREQQLQEVIVTVLTEHITAPPPLPPVLTSVLQFVNTVLVKVAC